MGKAKAESMVGVNQMSGINQEVHGSSESLRQTRSRDSAIRLSTTTKKLSEHQNHWSFIFFQMWSQLQSARHILYVLPLIK